jgi:transcriptional/translational regulatory protein YebC/TACO1
MPKDKIQVAVDRGNGVTASGAKLEPLAIEAIGPGNVAMVVECMAEHKLRCLQEVKAILTKFGAQPTPTAYLFSRKGVIRLARGDLDPEHVLEIALEIEGADDVEDVEEGESESPEIVITTDTSALGNVIQELKEKLKNVKILSSGMEYIPNEDTMVEVPEKRREELEVIINKLEDYQDVTNIATNMV